MDAKTLLSILDEDFSDANVEMAIAWLKTKKPTNKSAGRVLQKIFNHPKMEAEFDWLTDWSQNADWTFIHENILNLRSIKVFEWIVSLLNANPHHPSTGAVWASLLQDFRHASLEPGAKIWLETTKSKDDCANQVIEQLIRLNPTYELVEFAKKRLKKNFDLFPLRSLIEYAGDEEVYAAGAKVIRGKSEWWEKELIIEAMARSDMETNKESIYWFLSNMENHRYASHLFFDLGNDPTSNRLNFFCDWIAENYDSPLAKERLARPLFIDIGETNALKLWNWFKSGEASDVRFEVLIRGYDNAWCPLPEDAKAFVTEWIENHPKHKLVKYAESALTRVAKSSFKTIDGKEVGKVGRNEYSDEETRAIVLKADEFDEEAQKAIKEWIAKFPVEADKIKTAVHIFRSTSDPADFAAITYILNKSNLSLKTFLLSELLSGGAEEFIDMSLEVLTCRRLYKRWGSAHKDVGILIAELLKVRPNNEVVLKHAEHWLKIRPDQFEMDLFQGITEAVKIAREKS